MIYFDITKTGSVRHRSGLARLSERLREELGSDTCPVTWTEARDRVRPDDWFLTTELFSEAERPGFTAFINSRRCRTAAVFADAIPLKLPHVTWPQSVARHPHYLKLLAGFERVWAISVASRDELAGYWQWLGLGATPPINVLPLGADLDRQPRVTARAAAVPSSTPAILCLGILEPRKNQQFLLTVCAELWSTGRVFDAHIVGRVNPHFGPPIVSLIKRLRKRWPGLHYHAALDDARLDQLFRSVRATVCPTIAEGCGLPLLESLWHGVPCVCSDLPVLRENADGGGCFAAALNDPAAWRDAMVRVLFDDTEWTRLQTEAVSRRLPTWSETAQILRSGLR